MKHERSDHCRTMSVVWPCAISLFLLLYVVYVFLFMSKGWFSKLKIVHADGGSMSTPTVPSLIVRNATGGDDIDQIRIDSAPDETADDLVLTFSGEKLRPASFGSFKAYVVRNAEQLESTYTLSFLLHSEGEVNTENSPYNTMTTEQLASIQSSALSYVNTHIAFFYGYEAQTNTYYDWIPANTEILKTFHETVADEEQEITVYWVWIEYFTDISVGNTENGRPTIASNDRQQMLEQLAIPANALNWFNGDDINLSARYNNADMYLASALSNVDFKMEISTY